MLNSSDHDKLLDIWEIFMNKGPITVAEENLLRDLKIALGLVRGATSGKTRQEAIDRCLQTWERGFRTIPRT